MSIYTRFAEVTYMANVIKERFPKIEADPAGFCASPAVRYLPTMRLFSFLLAARSADVGRGPVHVLVRRTTPAHLTGDNFPGPRLAQFCLMDP